MKSKLANSTSVKSSFAKVHLGEIKVREFHLGEIKGREFHLGEMSPQWSQRGLTPRGVRTSAATGGRV